MRLSTRDVAPADRLSYASWILGSAVAPSAVTSETPSEYELDVTALELPSIAIVAQRGSPQRAVRTRSEIRRTSQRSFFLVLVLSGSSNAVNLTDGLDGLAAGSSIMVCSAYVFISFWQFRHT